jgi:hypothetical protein
MITPYATKEQLNKEADDIRGDLRALKESVRETRHNLLSGGLSKKSLEELRAAVLVDLDTVSRAIQVLYDHGDAMGIKLNENFDILTRGCRALDDVLVGVATHIGLSPEQLQAMVRPEHRAPEPVKWATKGVGV